jgi:hypothetical protein
MGNIRIIGERGGGKTTYLAALAYWPDKKRTGKKNKRIKLQALNEETRELAEKAENIIIEGESLEPTAVKGGIDALPLYSFGLEVKPWFQKSELINVAVRDYPGEIFEVLADYATQTPLHKEFIEECLTKDIDGCLILVAGWEQNNDKFTSKALRKFIDLMDRNDRLKDLRIAIALSKCERGELWPGRLDPANDLFEQHLSQTKAVLENSDIPSKNLRYYAISTFGVLDRTDPRPNRIDEGQNSVLRKPNKWQPYGLIDPLYWLSKGKRMGYV